VLWSEWLSGDNKVFTNPPEETRGASLEKSDLEKSFFIDSKLTFQDLTCPRAL
jgi:hypothetical protein